MTAFQASQLHPLYFFIHLFNKNILSIHYMWGILLWTETTMMSMTNSSDSRKRYKKEKKKDLMIFIENKVTCIV